MPISLYDVTVPSYLQTLGAVGGFLDKGLSYCRENDIDPEDIVETRLFPNMLPFRFQVRSVVHHSLGAIEGVKSGAFAPPNDKKLYTYTELQTLVADTIAAVKAVTPEDIDGREGADVMFQAGDFKMLFTAEGFLTSFSLPNFHFHASTAYGILRAKGAPLGKRDFMGELKLKV